ncbi:MULTISPECIES: DUF4132 domain-containing protein [unclassified Acidovorax]|uniref:DUF4132 domain-containing protein n=1 Tax=unclassified Acidovorax TaxID=2684926 RepID=UPI0028833626|nr:MULTISPECIES: DUF4132 domain-containing protein [unclassified Acidovorax]
MSAGPPPSVSGAFALPPELRAALPPGDPEARALPKASQITALRKRVLDKGAAFFLHAELPAPLRVQPADMRAWLEQQLEAADARLMGLAVQCFRQQAGSGSDDPAESLVHWLVLQHGLALAFQTLLQAALWRCEPGQLLLRQHGPLPQWRHALSGGPPGSLWQMRGHWLQAESSVRADCLAQLKAGWLQLPLHARAHFAMALPGLQPMAQGLIDDASAEQRERTGAWLHWAAGHALTEIAGNGVPLLGQSSLLALLVREHGPALLPTLIAVSAAQRDEALGWALAAYDDVPACAALARLAARDARSAKALRWACEQWPETALHALLQVLDDGTLPKGGAARLTPLLRTLAGLLGERLPALMQALAAPARRLLAPMVDAAGSMGEAAPREQWPAVLADPPWTRPAAPVPAPLPGLPVPELPPVQDWGRESREAWIERDRPYVYTQPGEAEKALAEWLAGWTPQAVAQADSEPALAQRLIDEWRRQSEDADPARRSHGQFVAVHAAPSLPPRLAVAFWNGVVSELSQPRAGGIVARHGVAALPGLLNAMRNGEDEHCAAQYLGAVELAPLMAQALARRPARRAMVRDWLRRFPAHAAAGLLPAALGEAGEPREQARAALRTLAAMGQADAVRNAARRYDRADVLTAAEALLSQDPLQDFPARIHARSKLPAFWQPAGWRRPRLREGGAALPEEVLHPLGLMLSFAADLPQRYAGLEQVLAACEPQSVADFAWDACAAWEAAGMPAPGSWAVRALGVVGTEDTARQLGALARRWSAPGAGGTATRIGWVLEALARLGSDAALLQLDAQARRNRIVAVREQAALRLAEAAEARGLSPEHLQDRVVPDLGLDARGSLRLDFGPRQFVVGFDEALVPHVHDWVDGRAGPRLASAPRPRASDDPALAADAVARFKALKQDAETVASQQPARLERAMCEGRRWSPEAFRPFLAGHPLMRHLVERLVWGVVFDEKLPPGQLPVLQGAFRVNAEGGWVDAKDDAFVPPAEGPGASNADRRPWFVVLAHPLQLDAPQIAGFTQQLSDYELIQPFEQLQRAVHRPTEAEQNQRALTRWAGKQAWPGPLWGLEARGWLRGHGDGGIYTHAVRRLPGGGALTLHFGPGLDRQQRSDRDQAQTLGELHHGGPLSGLSPLAFSEAVRDLESIAR